MLDCFLCVHEPQPRDPAQRILQADLRVGWEDAAHFAEKRYQEMLEAKGRYNSGYVDLAYMPALTSKQFRFYRHIWVIEYDVDYAGNWANFSADAMQSGADFIAHDHCPAFGRYTNWSWWPGVRVPPGVAPEHAGASITRLSASRRTARTLTGSRHGPTMARAFRGTVSDDRCTCGPCHQRYSSRHALHEHTGRLGTVARHVRLPTNGGDTILSREPGWVCRAEPALSPGQTRFEVVERFGRRARPRPRPP